MYVCTCVRVRVPVVVPKRAHQSRDRVAIAILTDLEDHSILYYGVFTIIAAFPG